MLIRGTTELAGLAVRPDLSQKGHHLVYTWTNNVEYTSDDDSEEEEEEDDRPEWKPSAIKVWSGKDGSYKHSFLCDIGDDKEGVKANPSIATLVFCRLFVDSRCVDSIIVGLHCMTDGFLEYEDEYLSDFDLDKAQQAGEGNILPFYEHSNGLQMETWRGNSGVIRAMAVIPHKYLLTFIVLKGTGSSN